ncbi:hypothetical protein PTI98_008853 [Pleurotus ostreatus]|uniref:Uncharacterized protein n=1 Tax=Pleurotus cornucopiae TaxID=5321 RepID=A0ACB7IUH2_PLECO|nr:hypothetical protein CCMSSC00406_0005698 [Pleurotus cornucopiae]KAJ8693907.1 hypothetical protein PTI98_008853 [Pleurotus ostreatus]
MQPSGQQNSIIGPMASARASPYAQAAPDTHAIPDARLATPEARLATAEARCANAEARCATAEARHATAEPLLTPYQLRQVQHTAANVLVDAYAAGMLPSMNDELLRRRVEYYLDWPANHLDTCQGRMAISQLRWLVLHHLHAALESTSIRYTILGLALEHIRQFLRAEDFW